MSKALTIAIISILASACHSAKQKANEVINKAGETVGQSTSEFVKGVGKGIGEAFNNDVDVFALKADGLTTGKIVFADSAGHDNVLSVYLIFNKDLDKEILVRVVDRTGLEYGRAGRQVTGKKGDAGFFDFYFNSRTSFESKSKFIFE
jgi:3-hydroxyacyl-CoA dehydrogenase